MGEGFQALPINAVIPDPGQPRKDFDKETLDALAASIREHGQLQPITVRPADEPGAYIIVAGERRWRAVVQLGELTILARVIKADDRHAYELAVTENMVRHDFNPMEEAIAYRRLSVEHGLSNERIAELSGRAVSRVDTILKLNELERHHQDLYRKGRMPITAVHFLLQLPEGQLRDTVVKKLQRGMGVREAETMVTGMLAKLTGTGGASKVKQQMLTSPYAPLVKAFQDELEASLEWRVAISISGRKGQVTMSFKDLSELNRLVKRVLK